MIMSKIMPHSEPCTYVIFGATGHLSRTKLLPALYHLEADNHIPHGTTILCISRTDWTSESWRSEVRSIIQDKVRGGLNDSIFQRFAERLRYLSGDLQRDEVYKSLKTALETDQHMTSNAAFYMALRPAEFGQVIQKLGEFGLVNEQHGWRRVVIEKPFGSDLESAQILQTKLHRYLREDQIYRIDHVVSFYLL